MVWVLPSYGRPREAAAVIASMRAHGSIEPGVLYVSSNDPSIADYRKLALPDGWIMSFTAAGRRWLGQMLNWALGEHPNEPWYGLIQDDLAIETDGFEAPLIAAAGRWGMASADTGYRQLAGDTTGLERAAMVFGGDLLRAMGCWMPQGPWEHYAMAMWEALASEFGNWTVLTDCRVAHKLPTSVAIADQTIYLADGEAFKAWLADGAHKMIRRVRSAMFSARGLSFDVAMQRCVMICTPCYRDPSLGHHMSGLAIAKLLTHLGIKHDFKVLTGSSQVPNARNSLVNAQFLPSGYTDLLFFDADMEADPWSVVELLATDKPFIGGPYRKKTAQSDENPDTWAFSFIPHEDLETDIAGNWKIAQIGTGFLLINRKVFEQMAREHPDWAIQPHAAEPGKPAPPVWTEFFAYEPIIDPATGLRCGPPTEDIAFCRRWVEMGGEIWLRPQIELGHYALHNFRGDIRRLLAAVGEAA